ncbi:hypothetical protein OUZ56_024055 [Daphnia magna]|uniref:Uncharacterized protein n=1 Tax=Daphnia magna TaxID=35525 RepID=A0ABR0B006_9CRUS|nr:hypothetical protein OUZ56_024055 [Daphnia magna]
MEKINKLLSPLDIRRIFEQKIQLKSEPPFSSSIHNTPVIMAPPLPFVATFDLLENSSKSDLNSLTEEVLNHIKVIWNGKKDKEQQQLNHCANLLFLYLIKDNYPKLGAKGLKVLPLQEAGYSFSNNKDTGTKSKIKWNNLLAKRKEYAKLISATGSSADVVKKKPSNYDEIEFIIVTPPKPIMASINTESKLTPIFMKRDDGISFKQMKTVEITQIIQELESELGLFDKGGVTLATGGDLFIRQTTKEQQMKLLKVNHVLNGTVMVTFTQSRSANNSRVTIHQVPTGDTDDEIYLTLKQQGYKVNSISEKGTTHHSHQSSNLTYSQALRGNASTSAIDPETEIINGKIEAIQTELKQIRAELCKVKALEGKVASMDLTVRNVESSLNTLETGQLASNLKLDKICLLLTKLLPNLDEEEMDIEQPVENPSKGSGLKTPSTMTRLAPAKNQNNEGLDPASKKPKSSLDPKTTTRK